MPPVALYGTEHRRPAAGSWRRAPRAIANVAVAACERFGSLTCEKWRNSTLITAHN